MCYAKVCSVSNMVAGLQEKLTPAEVARVSKLITPRLGQALIEAVRAFTSDT
jgi:purine nucleoside phosphorylase